MKGTSPVVLCFMISTHTCTAASWNFVYSGRNLPHEGLFTRGGGEAVEVESLVDDAPLGDKAFHLVNRAGTIQYSAPLLNCPANQWTIEFRVKIVSDRHPTLGNDQQNALSMYMSYAHSTEGALCFTTRQIGHFHDLYGSLHREDFNTAEYHVYRIVADHNTSSSKVYVDGILRFPTVVTALGSSLVFGDGTVQTGTHDAVWDYIAWTCGAFSPNELESPSEEPPEPPCPVESITLYGELNLGVTPLHRDADLGPRLDAVARFAGGDIEIHDTCGNVEPQIRTYGPAQGPSAPGGVAGTWQAFAGGQPKWLMRVHSTATSAHFYMQDRTKPEGQNYRFFIGEDGNVGIGTREPTARLHVSGDIHVSGNIRASAIEVPYPRGSPDYVFDDSYSLMSLDQLRDFVRDNKHLPNIPGVSAIQSKAISLAEFDMRLLEKIEELTLYTIDQYDAIQRQQRQIDELHARLVQLEQLPRDQKERD